MSDWASQAADSVDKVAGILRDKTVIPARRAAVGLVYGILAASFGFVAFIIALITIFRVLTYATGRAWLSYLILGGICLIAGVLLWTRRGPRLDLSTSVDS